MAEPKQSGTKLLVKNAPKFANFIVVKDTWQPEGNAEQETFANGDSETENVTTFDPGTTVSCDWVVKDGATPAEQGDEVTEDDGDQRVFVVLSVRESNYGRAIKQSVQLLYKDSLAAAIAAANV